MIQYIQRPVFVFAVENPTDLHIVDLQVYTHVRDAILDVEHYEVNDGLYEVYDVQGRKLVFHADERNKVHLVCTEKNATHLKRLETLLRFYLSQYDEQTDYTHADLATLLEQAVSNFSYIPWRTPWEVIMDWLHKLKAYITLCLIKKR